MIKQQKQKQELKLWEIYSDWNELNINDDPKSDLI